VINNSLGFSSAYVEGVEGLEWFKSDAPYPHSGTPASGASE
jgi:hypothetical protein